MTTTFGNADSLIATTGTDVLTALGSQRLLMKVSVNNQDAAAQTVSAYRVPSGGSPAASNIIVDTVSIPAGETVVLPLSGQPITENQVLHMVTSVTQKMVANVGFAILSA